ncbi:MAG: S1 RNA-binding domain-containing protein, partial [Opitutales bacterium]|nr:S1 RNA-binding domain-containing protein [Opitutales bacterium]
MRLLKRENDPYREIVINVEPFEKRVALLVEGVMQKFEIERNGDESMVGAIFKGKIQNLEPGLKAAFVDIGQPKNAFLHYWDIFPTTTDNSYEVVRENKSKEQKKAQKFSTKDIPEKFPIGTEIIVQITKTQIGTKGPRVTTNIAIPGRYLVLMPFAGQCGISRKIEDRAERER